MQILGKSETLAINGGYNTEYDITRLTMRYCHATNANPGGTGSYGGGFEGDPQIQLV